MTRYSHSWAVLGYLLAAAAPCIAAAPATNDLTPIDNRAAATDPMLRLVEQGQPRVTICVMTQVRGVGEAVAHLQSFVERASGAKLPVVQGKITPPAIVIGDCDLTMSHGLIGEKLPVEGFAIRTIADHLLIVGNDKSPGGSTVSSGTAWGVLDVVERFVGARWYFPTELGQHVPKAATIDVPPVRYEDAPRFRRREIWPPMSNPWNGSGTQLGLLHQFQRAVNSWPRQLVVHSPDWSKVAEYTKDRPEVYQLRSDGTRDHSMLCYGHPRTLATHLENVERHAAGQKPVHLGIVDKTITVSPADAEIACYCEHCRKLWNPEGGQYGSASKIVAQFAADLGREVKQRWPDLFVLYLPYLNYTAAPEGVTFPDNVEVQLCGMPGLAQYKEPEIAKSEQATIDRWIQLTGRPIQNWHYSCWPEDRTPAVYLFPHTVREFYRNNRDKTVGTFINGTTDHWPRQHLSLYCWLKVMWNPDFDVDAALDEYCRRMYGPAAGTMRELVRLQTDRWEQSRWTGGRMSPKGVYDSSFPKDVTERMEGLLAQAKREAAGDETIDKRVAYYAGPFEEFFKHAKDYYAGSGMRPLLIQKVGENPKVDGKLDDAVWQRATPVDFVRGWDRKQSQPTYPTTVRAVWTAEGVTIGFHMSEPTPTLLERGITGRDDSMAWWDDNIELLFDVTGQNEGEFYHFIINPNAAVADAKEKDFSRDFLQVKSAADVGKDAWTLEVYVPYAVFPEASKPGSGSNTLWHGNFTRHRVADQGLKPKVGKQQNSQREYQRMNTTYAPPSNNLTDFAKWQFVE